MSSLKMFQVARIFIGFCHKNGFVKDIYPPDFVTRTGDGRTRILGQNYFDKSFKKRQHHAISTVKLIYLDCWTD